MSRIKKLVVLFILVLSVVSVFYVQYCYAGRQNDENQQAYDIYSNQRAIQFAGTNKVLKDLLVYGSQTGYSFVVNKEGKAGSLINGEEDWHIEDIYGNWKVTRLIGLQSGSKDLWTYGNQIGRSFKISEDKIVDSQLRGDRMQEFYSPTCYSMDILRYEENDVDVSAREDCAHFQIETGIILSEAGISDSLIFQGIFYALGRQSEDIGERDYFMAHKFEVFSYSRDNKDMLVMQLPVGVYLLERYRTQEKADRPDGLWMVESLVSRGGGELWGIDFFDRYGECIDISEGYVEKDGNRSPVKWSVKEVNKENFENRYGIKEGLGLENETIKVWYGDGAEDFSAIVIPVNEQEIIYKIGEEWYKLHKVESYDGKVTDELDILQGEWKFVQLLASEDVNEENELQSDYKAWWYGYLLRLDESSYADGAGSDWIIEEYDADAFYDEYDVPSSVVNVLNGMETVHAAFRSSDGVEEIYIILDSDTMIRERNGLWYKIVRIS